VLIANSFLGSENLDLQDANEMILRPADFRYPKLAVKANFFWLDPQIPSF
jgi:hypothetical protein